MAAQPPLRHLNGVHLKDMVQSSLLWLRAHKEAVNALNVFPVPDGDTGTNMLLTMEAAWSEVQKTVGATPGIYEVAHAVAHGALMGARGNSGVILSQLWRGFARGLDGKTAMDTTDFAHSMREACDTAYKGVIKPVEGTILSVSRAAADAAEKAVRATDDLMFAFEQVLGAAKDAVARTPLQLDILRQAGVVDSGGQGLFVILEGMLRCLQGEPVDIAPVEVKMAFTPGAHFEDTIEPGQDYELVFDLKPRPDLSLEKMYDELAEFGTSIQVGGGDDALKIHIHVPTEHFYATQKYAFTLGVMVKIAVENLQDQLADMHGGAKWRGAYKNLTEDDIATIVVAPSDGLAKVFESLNSSVIISGGQTMNPSTEDFVKAMEFVPCKRALLIPNNSNILMAARQAVELVNGKQALVILTKTIPQGIAAMIAFNAQAALDDNLKSMQRAAQNVRTGEVTIATRTVEIDGVNVKEGQAIGLFDDRLSASGASIADVTWQLLEQMKAAEGELLTIYYGAGTSKDDAQAFADAIHQRYEHLEIEVIEGGQPHYPYLMSLE